MKKVRLVVLRQPLSPEFRRLRKAARPYEEFLLEAGVHEGDALMYAAILCSPGRKTRVEHLKREQDFHPNRPTPEIVTKLAIALDARGDL